MIEHELAQRGTTSPHCVSDVSAVSSSLPVYASPARPLIADPFPWCTDQPVDSTDFLYRPQHSPLTATATAPQESQTLQREKHFLLLHHLQNQQQHQQQQQQLQQQLHQQHLNQQQQHQQKQQQHQEQQLQQQQHLQLHQQKQEQQLQQHVLITTSSQPTATVSSIQNSGNTRTLLQYIQLRRLTQLLQKQQQQHKEQQQQQLFLQQQQNLQKPYTLSGTTPAGSPLPEYSGTVSGAHTNLFTLGGLDLVAKATSADSCSTNVATTSSMTFARGSPTEGPTASGENMDSQYLSGIEIMPYVSTCADLSLPTDIVDASIYASSPNSLFMYDQEKMDMQSTLGLNTSCSTNFSDSFDLESKYEMFQDLNSTLPMVMSMNDQVDPSSLLCESGITVWGGSDIKEPEKLAMVKMEVPDDTSSLTLAELNYNLEDITEVINVEMSHSPSQIKTERSEVKQEPSTWFSPESCSEVNKTYKHGQYNSDSSSQGNLPRRVAAMSVGDIAGSPPAPGLLLLSSHQLSDDKKPVISETQEVDISDSAVLQRLLMTRQTTAQRIPRKRTISEPTRSVLGKRTVANTGLDMDRKWEEIVEFINSETRKFPKEEPEVVPTHTVKRERKRYDSASSVLTMTSTEDDSDQYEDDSDSDLEGGYDIGSLDPAESLLGGIKEKQYFWQYNVQSKGPKGTRVHFDLEEDPHALNDFEDPVFDPLNSKISGIGFSVKHGGKARKGDGNDIVPSPRKLCQIGLQLRKISRQISDFVPVSELPSAARSKSRKEKNKLASRACRLKKKAQHEANKIKLHGLEKEHRQLLIVMKGMQKHLHERLYTTGSSDGRSMIQMLEELKRDHLDTKIAGHTTEFVNSVIRKVEEGDASGGIQIHATRSYPKELHN